MSYSRRRMRESKDLGLPCRAVSLTAFMICYIGSCETLSHISWGMRTSDLLSHAQEKMLFRLFSFNTLVANYQPARGICQRGCHYKPNRTRNCKAYLMVVPYNEATCSHLLWPQHYVTPISTQVFLQGTSLTATREVCNTVLPLFIV
jgi:hypothetical protein